MGQKLGSGFDLSPAEDKMDFSHHRAEGDGNSFNVTSPIKLSLMPHLPVGASGNSCSRSTPRSPLLPAKSADMGNISTLQGKTCQSTQVINLL